MPVHTFSAQTGRPPRWGGQKAGDSEAAATPLNVRPDESNLQNHPTHSASPTHTEKLKAAGRLIESRLRNPQNLQINNDGPEPGPESTSRPTNQAKSTTNRTKLALFANSIFSSLKYASINYSADMGSFVVYNAYELANKSPIKPPPNHSEKTINEYLGNGTFGTLSVDSEKINGIVVYRGDKLSNVVVDPKHQESGLLLSARAMKIYNKHKGKPEYQSDQARFNLAMRSAIEVREDFLRTPVLGTQSQNELAAFHAHDSRWVPNGSPFLSLTLNEALAGYFAAGGYEGRSEVEPNKDGKVFQSSVNNQSTVFPVVYALVKGVGHNQFNISDHGMKITDQLKIPYGEVLIVGGFYFNNKIDFKDALRQNPEKFRSVSDLSNMSTQMFEGNQNFDVNWFDFSYHVSRFERQHNFSFSGLN